MSDFPINYSFVQKKDVTITENGVPVTYKVLVLDDDANTRYFKKVDSFNKTLLEAKELTDDFSHWEMTQSFACMAVQDLFKEEAAMLEASDGNKATIFGLPVQVINMDTPKCFLVTSNNNRIENVHWVHE